MVLVQCLDGLFWAGGSSLICRHFYICIFLDVAMQKTCVRQCGALLYMSLFFMRYNLHRNVYCDSIYYYDMSMHVIAITTTSTLIILTLECIGVFYL